MIFRIKYVIFLTAILTNLSLMGQNLIKNGNFLKTIDDNKPADWEIYPNPLPQGSSITIDTTNSYSGGRSVRIHNDKPVYSRVQQINVKVKPRTWYLISFYVKGQNITTNFGAGSRMFIGRNGSLDRSLLIIGPGIKPEKKNNWTFKWRKYSKKFNTGANKSLGITLYLHKASGTVWYDNIELIEITPDYKKRMDADNARKIINKEINIIQKAAKKQNNEDVIKKLNTINTQLKDWVPKNTPIRSEGLPFYPIQKKIYALMGEILVKRYPQKTVLISQSNPFKRTKWLRANLKNNADRIIARGLCGDIEQFALNFTNCSTSKQKITFTVPATLNVKVRKVVEVEIDNSELIGDALRLMRTNNKREYSFEIPAGMTKQLWFELKLPKIPGTTQNKFTFKFADKEKSIDLKSINYKTAFPNSMPIKTFTYAYPYVRSLTKKRLKQCAEDLKKHHVNAMMIHQSSLPHPVFDTHGKILPEQMDWSGIDKCIKRFPFCHTFIIKSMLYIYPDYFIKGIKVKRMSPQWKACVVAWMKELVKGFKKRGIGYERLLVAWFDEPNTKSVDALKECAKLVHEADPKLRMYSNFHYALPTNYVKKLTGIVDVIAPEVNVLLTKNMRIIKKSGKELWGYRVQSKNANPQDIRKSFWIMRKNNIKGFSFWCYRDNHNEWMPKGQHSYSVIYSGDTQELTPSKRWEAWREGIEDYTLLTMLKARNLHAYQKIINRYNDVKIDSLRKQLLTQLCK